MILVGRRPSGVPSRFGEPSNFRIKRLLAPRASFTPFGELREGTVPDARRLRPAPRPPSARPLVPGSSGLSGLLGPSVKGPAPPESRALPAGSFPPLPVRPRLHPPLLLVGYV